MRGFAPSSPARQVSNTAAPAADRPAWCAQRQWWYDHCTHRLRAKASARPHVARTTSRAHVGQGATVKRELVLRLRHHDDRANNVPMVPLTVHQHTCTCESINGAALGDETERAQTNVPAQYIASWTQVGAIPSRRLAIPNRCSHHQMLPPCPADGWWRQCPRGDRQWRRNLCGTARPRSSGRAVCGVPSVLPWPWT